MNLNTFLKRWRKPSFLGGKVRVIEFKLQKKHILKKPNKSCWLKNQDPNNVCLEFCICPGKLLVYNVYRRICFSVKKIFFLGQSCARVGSCLGVTRILLWNLSQPTPLINHDLWTYGPLRKYQPYSIPNTAEHHAAQCHWSRWHWNIRPGPLPSVKENQPIDLAWVNRFVSEGLQDSADFSHDSGFGSLLRYRNTSNIKWIYYTPGN